MFWFLGILLIVLLGLWVWSRRGAWVFPVAIVVIIILALWLGFPGLVTAILIVAVVVAAALALFATAAIAAIVAVVGLVIALVVGLLSGGVNFPWNQPDTHAIDLKNPVAVAQLCGNNDNDSAHKAAKVLNKASDSKDDSDERKAVKDWGLDPANADQLNKAKAAVDARTKVQCDANGKPVELSAEQVEAAKVCLNAEEQKALTPGSDANDKIIAGCRTIGKAKFDGLAPENKGDVSNKNSYAYYAQELANTKDITVARYDTAILTKAKEENDRGVKSDNPDLAKQILAAFPGVNQGDVKIGTTGDNPVDFRAHTTEKGGNVFLSGADRILKTKEDIAAFLAEDSDAARAARDYVTKGIKAANYGDKEVSRAMNGLGYIPIQMKDASQILGTSYFKDGQVNILGEWRQSLPGDVYWLFVTEDGKFIPEATLRADCGNASMKMIRMVREDTPTAVGVSHGPGENVCVEEGKVATSTGECLPPAPPVCSYNCAHAPPPCVYDCVGQPICTENCTPVQTCPPNMPHGTWPVCKDDVAQAPQNQNNLPQQQMPNPLPARPQDAQPVEPAAPPANYAAPEQPAPQPAPVTQTQPDGSTTVIPAPAPNPEGPRPIATPEPAAPAPSEAPTSCAVAPGKTTC
jgi:hypothetical protein